MSFIQCTLLSLFLHGVLLVLFGLSFLFTSSKKINLRGAIRVEIVDLPDKVVNKITKPVLVKKKPVPVKARKKKRSYKRKQKAAFDKLKKVISQQGSKKKEVKSKQKGNRLNPSSGLGGLDKIRFDNYYAQLKEHVYDQWEIPSWLASKELKALVLVVIKSSGQVVSFRIVEFSGDDTFDRSVLEAIKNATPFPEVPERLRSFFGKKEIELGFR